MGALADSLESQIRSQWHLPALESFEIDELFLADEDEDA